MTRPGSDTNDETEPNGKENAESEAYAEDTPLTWVFGDHPEAKLITTFLSERDRDLNVTTIADIAGLSRSAVKNHLDELLEYGIIKTTREMNGGYLYQLNEDSEYAKIFYKLEDQLLEEWYRVHDSEDSTDENEFEIDPGLTGDPIPDVEEAYAEGTPLTEVLGDHPEVKIVATLLSEHSTDINVTDIGRMANVSRNDVYEHLETLRKHDLVKQPREVGVSKMYTIDDSKRSIQLINELEHRLLVDWYNSKEIVRT